MHAPPARGGENGPTMSRRAGIDPAQTRRMLLDATLELLGERGVRGLRVSEVAERAGLTTGAIYSQFSSKADLLIAAVRDSVPAVIAAHVASGDHSSVLDLFAEVGRSLPERGTELGPLLLDMIASGIFDVGISDLVTEPFVENEQVTVAALRQAQADGEVDPGLDAEALGRFLSMLSLGALVTGALDFAPVDTDAWNGIVLRLLEAARPSS